jgi:hypothetical protein
MEKRITLPPHEITAEGKKYLASLTPQQLELHQLAIEKLGSSYFVERTHGFRKWKAALKK